MTAPSLAAQQTALLDALLLNTIDLIALDAEFIWASGLKRSKNAASLLRGLRAYRAHAHVQCVAALQASHPALQQLLGEDNFAHLAQNFWQAQPPERGDLARWGEGLPAFLQHLPSLKELLAEHAYLPDVAQLEWALHRAATTADSALDRASFSKLATMAPEALTLRLSPGCFLQTSAFPTAAILQLHRPQDAAMHMQARATVAQGWALDAGRKFHALVWRRGFQPCVRTVGSAEAALIAALLAKQSLIRALDAALACDASFDFSAWLQSQVGSEDQGGLVIAVQSLQAVPHAHLARRADH